jgi:lysophospholipase
MTHYISHEKDVNKYPNNAFMQFFNDKLTTGFWKQASGVESFYGYVINEKATKVIVISQGRSESIIKYAEFIYELYENGYSIFLFDHQGQGESTRLTENRQIGYVKHFNDYVDDLNALLSHVLNPLLAEHSQSDIPKVLLCHSMGGAIGVLFVQTYPHIFTKLILSAPMLGLSAPVGESLTQFIVKTVLKTQSLFGLPIKYFWGQTNYEAYPFDKNRLTNCEIRYRVFREMMAQYPQNQLGGISFDWLAQAIPAMREARSGASLILLPTLVLMAEQEQIVDNQKIVEFAEALSNSKLVKVANSQHEVLFEQDEARHLVMNEILGFLRD